MNPSPGVLGEPFGWKFGAATASNCHQCQYIQTKDPPFGIFFGVRVLSLVRNLEKNPSSQHGRSWGCLKNCYKTPGQREAVAVELGEADFLAELRESFHSAEVRVSLWGKLLDYWRFLLGIVGVRVLGDKPCPCFFVRKIML